MDLNDNVLNGRSLSLTEIVFETLFLKASLNLMFSNIIEWCKSRLVATSSLANRDDIHYIFSLLSDCLSIIFRKP